MLSVLSANLGAVLVLFGVTWAISVGRGDVSVIDVVWGAAFVVVAWVSRAVGDAPGARPTVLALLVSIWGLRLSGYLAHRWWHEPEEDRRYAVLRERHGASFAWRSLPTIFGTQAVLVLVVSLPIQAVAAARGHHELGAFDAVAAVVILVGVLFETIGDEQLRRFKASPTSSGQVLDTGLWHYTRHPNYFGDFLVWWGIGLVALGVGAWWSLVGPIVMSLLLVAGTGKPTLERTITDRRPGYENYVRRTSGFVPLPPKRG